MNMEVWNSLPCNGAVVDTNVVAFWLELIVLSTFGLFEQLPGARFARFDQFKIRTNMSLGND